MLRWFPPPALLALLGLAALAAPAAAGDIGTYRYDVGDSIRAVRQADLDGDGRQDLVVLTAPRPGTGDPERLLLLRAPTKATPRTYFAPETAAVLALDGEYADFGAMCVGRFHAGGRACVRLLGPNGFVDIGLREGHAKPVARGPTASLFRRSAGRTVSVWEGVSDLDGDGYDEVWFPDAAGNGSMRVLFGNDGRSQRLSIETHNRGSTSDAHLLIRNAYVPRLVPADLDGAGGKELVALRGTELLVWDLAKQTATTTTPAQPTQRIELPFLRADAKQPTTHMRTARVQLEDVDADGRTDLLVTLISGRRDKIGSLRTTLFHYAGPFVDPKTGSLVRPRGRIDTESVALHPTFRDLDSDGDLDYVGDSIRATSADVIGQLMGRDARITYVGFRFDRAAGTYETTPYFTVERTYPHAEAVANTFARAAWISGDFDGDGQADLLDLGDLSGVEILRGVPRTGRTGPPLTFGQPILPRIPVKAGLAAAGLVLDLNGDPRSDAVLWGPGALYVILTGDA